MLVVNRLGPEAARYYLGDGPPGEWRGAAALRLGVEGAVDGADLAAVLAGRDPRTGAPLALRRVAHRRAGWDLIFAAPKSVSLLHGLAPPPRAAAIADAQARAVDDVVAWLEAQACWARRGARLVAAEGLVAACYHHRRSAAGDPHLHTHLLVGNLAGTADGRWSALDGSSLWVHRRATAAAYHLSLRHHLGSLGLDRWRQAPDGSFEVDGVPRGAIEASSRRRAEVVAAVAAEGGVTRTARRAARVRTRSAVGGEWYTAVSGAGFGILEAAGLARQPEGAPAALGASGERATAVLPGDAGAGTLEAEAAARVTRWLLHRRSTFTAVDVMAALDASQPTGAPATDAQRWAEEFCARSPRVTDGRATTPVAARVDATLARSARGGRGRGVGTAPEAAVRVALDGRPHLAGAGAGAALWQLATAGHAVDVLRPPPGVTEPLVPQAALLDAARAAWEAAGHRVAVVCPEASTARWSALAGLRPPTGEGPPTVLVVDQADRVPSLQLQALLDQAARVPAKVVLVRGGTLPGRRRAWSEGLEAVDRELGVDAGLLRRAPGRASAGTTLGAVEEVVASWARSASSAVMVGLGPAEVGELNARARAVLRAAGVLQGPDAVVGGRPFAAGDRVLPLSRAVAPPGAEGRVVAVDPTAGRLEVAWGPRRAELDHWAARRLGHAYAVTPPGLGLRAGPVLLLGDPAALGRHAARVVRAASVARAAPSLEATVGRARSRGAGLGW